MDEEFGKLEVAVKAIAIVGDRWWRQMTNRTVIGQANSFHVVHEKC